MSSVAKHKDNFRRWYSSVRQVRPGPAFVACHHCDHYGKTPDVLVGSDSAGDSWSCFTPGCHGCGGGRPASMGPYTWWQDDAVQLGLFVEAAS